jgi:hypothetical protein
LDARVSRHHRGTSVTGFFFPFKGITPAIILGILSLVVLAAAIAARYAFHLAGSSRWIYVVGSVVALYFNVFVLVVQAFLKIPALHALAPKGSEPPFAIAQGIVLVFFILAGIRSVKRFTPSPSEERQHLVRHFVPPPFQMTRCLPVRRWIRCGNEWQLSGPGSRG